MMKVESFFTASPDETTLLARMLGELISSPFRLALLGEPGAGKTLFVQGLARGFNVPDTIYVTSPSYALIHKYPGKLPMYHADLYRLSTRDDFEEIGLFELFHSCALCVVEWAERLENMDEFDMILFFEIPSFLARKITIKACGLEAENLLRSLRQKGMKFSAENQV